MARVEEPGHPRDEEPGHSNGQEPGHPHVEEPEHPNGEQNAHTHVASPVISCKISPSLHTQQSDVQASSQRDVQFTDISKFQIMKVLRHSDYSVQLLAQHVALPGKAVITLKKARFDVDERRLQEVISSSRCLTELLRNDVFSHHTAHLPPHLNKVEVTIKYPVAEAAFTTFDAGRLVAVSETAELYASHSAAYIRSRRKFHKWIYNILDDKCEADRVILRDSDPLNGFVLLSDMKWTGEKLSDLFCQAIVNRRDLASLRDLTRDCLPLLYNIRDKGTMAIEEKYGVKANQLRVYLHYLPSFYHLHVHFASINSCHEGMEYGKVHPLDMVINNLEIKSDYYSKVTLTLVGNDSHPHPLLRRDEMNGEAFMPVCGKRKRETEDPPLLDLPHSSGSPRDQGPPTKLARRSPKNPMLPTFPNGPGAATSPGQIFDSIPACITGVPSAAASHAAGEAPGTSAATQAQAAVDKGNARTRTGARGPNREESISNADPRSLAPKRRRTRKNARRTRKKVKRTRRNARAKNKEQSNNRDG
ncbi:m7GpppX diphosphatase isoform X2 [Hyalella azteca]|uniref:m7GpppX diphosphatase n=1 Tax=Hyalella azteca TaxID=294128 RepID=A0A8B7PL03_HYAAZ|nr:m7GpppX diphosphatase isoform X2 [Hyalella azteca]